VNKPRQVSGFFHYRFPGWLAVVVVLVVVLAVKFVTG
jgi:hypothetical protein